MEQKNKMNMKSFFKKLFGFGTKKKDVSKMLVQEDKVVNETTTITVPISVSHKKIPLSVLKKLAPIRDLKDDEIQKIEYSTLGYASGSFVFVLGKKSDKIYYLLKGEIEFTLDGSEPYCIDDASSLANLPINSGKIYGATAITKSSCIILEIPVSVSNWWVNESKKKHIKSVASPAYFYLPEEVPTTPFFKDFSEAFRTDRLSFPTLPQVVVQLRKAVQEGIGIADAVKIIQLDAIVVARLIQLANSALYASSEPVKNSHEAVLRLGLDATCQLVMSIGIKQLFQSKSTLLMQEMKRLWKNSAYISSLSFVLAQECGGINPEDALLAGLICDIGAIPLLNFAEKQGDSSFDINELENVMPYFNPSVGTFVLQKLNFTNELIEIPTHAENWYYESGRDSLTLIDLVILAKFHSYLGTDKVKNLPCINLIPAYTKLKNRKLNPDFSLAIVTKAQQRIDAAMGIFHN